MKSSPLSILTLIVGVILSIQIGGCTLIGLGMGASSSKNASTIPGWHLEKVQVGNSIELLMADGAVHKGIFKGEQFEPMAKYAIRYADWYQRQEETTGIPLPDDSIMVVLTSGEERTNTFLGLDRNVLYLGKDRGGYEAISLQNIKSVFNRANEACSGNKLFSLVNFSDIPVRSVPALALQGQKNNKSYLYFNPDDVEQVKIAGTKYAGAGLLIGLAVDVLVVGMILNEIEESWGNSTSDGFGSSAGSCPFVYSHIGGQYLFESETLGGTYFESAQRSDWTPLKKLQEEQGHLGVRIANARPETDFIDEVKLVVVDHLQGTTVFPSHDGQFYRLKTLLTPLTAIDYNGSDVSEQIHERDGKFWLSDPFDRHLDDVEDFRDGIVMEFPKDPDASAISLAVSTKNTAWFMSIGQEMMELPGKDWEAFYDQFNQSEAARNQLNEMMTREMLLHAEIWDGTQWTSAGQIEIVGPMTWRDEVVQVDLSTIQTPTLKIRFSSTAGFWMIDSIQASHDVVAPRYIQTLTPDLVVSHDNRDIREEVLDEDGVYFAMPSNEYWLDATFDTIPDRPDMDRSYFLKSTGFYSPQLSTQEPANLTLLDEILSEPGAVGRFSLSRLYARLDGAITSW